MAHQFGTAEKKQIFGVTFYMVLLSWASIKIVLPILPGLDDVLKTSSANIQLSVTIFLLLFSLSRLIWGPVAQMYGNLIALRLGIFLSIAGSIMSMLASNFTWYIIGRGLEGIGMGSIPIVSFAILPNLFDKKTLSRKMAYVSGISAAMPAIAPVIGGFLMKFIDWRAVFGFLIVSSILLIILSYKYLKYVNNFNEDERTNLRMVLSAYFSCLKERKFWGYTTPAALTSGTLIGYYSASPYWFVDQMGYSAEMFSYLLLPTVGMFVMGSFVISSFVGKINIHRLFLVSSLLIFITVGLSILGHFFQIRLSLSLIIVMSILGFCAGAQMVLTVTAVLSHFKHIAAIASAFMTSYVFLLSSLFSTISMKLNATNVWSVVLYIGIAAFWGLLFYVFFVLKEDMKK